VFVKLIGSTVGLFKSIRIFLWHVFKLIIIFSKCVLQLIIIKTIIEYRVWKPNEWTYYYLYEQEKLWY
jgi:hypothetical protein